MKLNESKPRLAGFGMSALFYGLLSGAAIHFRPADALIFHVSVAYFSVLALLFVLWRPVERQK